MLDIIIVFRFIFFLTLFCFGGFENFTKNIKKMKKMLKMKNWVKNPSTSRSPLFRMAQNEEPRAEKKKKEK